MEAYRQIVNVKNHTLSILLPDHFKTEKVEVIVFPVEEPDKSKKRKPSDYVGCISKETAESMLKDLEKSREEWNRDF